MKMQEKWQVGMGNGEPLADTTTNSTKVGTNGRITGENHTTTPSNVGKHK